MQLGASSGKSKLMLTTRAAPRRTAQAALQAIGFASGVATQAVSWVLVIGVRNTWLSSTARFAQPQQRQRTSQQLLKPNMDRALKAF
jgi:hypothetical protein